MASEFDIAKRHGRKCFCSDCLQDEIHRVEDELDAERRKVAELQETLKFYEYWCSFRAEFATPLSSNLDTLKSPHPDKS